MRKLIHHKTANRVAPPCSLGSGLSRVWDDAFFTGLFHFIAHLYTPLHNSSDDSLFAEKDRADDHSDEGSLLCCRGDRSDVFAG